MEPLVPRILPDPVDAALDVEEAQCLRELETLLDRHAPAHVGVEAEGLWGPVELLDGAAFGEEVVDGYVAVGGCEGFEEGALSLGD